ADGLALAKDVADGVKQAGWNDRDVLVCPPATLVLAVADAGKGRGVLVGGENCHAKASGAHTGEVAAEMLRDCGATYVIVGHSERRAGFGESDALARAQTQAARRGRDRWQSGGPGPWRRGGGDWSLSSVSASPWQSASPARRWRCWRPSS